MGNVDDPPSGVGVVVALGLSPEVGLVMIWKMFLEGAVAGPGTSAGGIVLLIVGVVAAATATADSLLLRNSGNPGPRSRTGLSYGGASPP